MIDKTASLGDLIRMLRQKHGWTLREMSVKVGIPLSTLAKVETGKLSLTYDKIQLLASRVGLTMAEFLSQGGTPEPEATRSFVTARRSLATGGNSVQVSTSNYDYDYLCVDLREKRMVPILARIRTHDILKFGGRIRHPGEEFLYVLEGSVEVHLEFYKSTILTVGQGIYFDSTMEHAFIAKDCESALVLSVCSGEDKGLEAELMTLAKGESRPMT